MSMPGMIRKLPKWLSDPMGPLSLRLAYLPSLAPWLLRFLRAGRPEKVAAQARALRSLLEQGIETLVPLLRHAGASEILVTSSRRWVLMHELRGEAEPSFDEQLKRLSPCDLLLVEGFKHAPIPKLEVWREETGEPLLHPNDPHIVAVASDREVRTRLPRFDLNDCDGIEDFILSYNAPR
mgnify:CR=1 FL=1